MNNHKAYSDSGLVGYYKQLSLLQPAEDTILDLLRSQLSDMKILDIGIGGGRTTLHFAPLAKTYIGIDYSEGMIAACDRRFSALSQLTSRTFQVGDARNMSEFADNSFDFILFSFNGIDYVSHSDRIRILEEIHRVGKIGSYFCFSSHNLQGMIAEFAWKNKLSLNPLSTYINLVMLGILRLSNLGINSDRLESADHLILRDESHNFRLQTYYIHPQAQLKQLEPYFKDIKTYSWQTGLEISESEELKENSDLWLYYLCTNK